MDLAGLIKAFKGDRSYAALARDSGDVLNAAAWQQYGSGSRKVIELPKPATIAGMAKALGVSQQTVLLAAMASCPHMDNPDERSLLAACLPAGTDRLTEAQVAWLVAGVRLLLSGN